MEYGVLISNLNIRSLFRVLTEEVDEYKINITTVPETN